MNKYLLYIFFFAILNCICSQSLVSQSGHWEKLNPKNNPGERWGIEMAPIGENKVILFGGDRNAKQKLNDTWIFDLKKGNWEQILCKTSPSGRSDYSLTQISKNQVMLFGGEEDSIKYFVSKLCGDFWIFDLDSLNWYKVYEDTTFKLLNRYRHKASLLNDSLILIFAGDFSGFGDMFTNDIYLFNFITNTISKNIQFDPLVLPREFPQMDRIKDNLLFIFGGFTNNGSTNDNYYIDSTFKMKEIKELKSNCIPLAQAGMKHIKDGIFLLFAGDKEIRYNKTTWYDSTWIFDYYNKMWTKLDLENHPIGRLEPGLSIIDTNKVLMFGGFIRGAPNTTFYSETWLFTLDSEYTAIKEYTDNNKTNSIYQVSSNELKIELSKNKNYLEDIIIYDILGVPYTPPNPLLIEGEQLRVDISGFVLGVYFVKIGDRVKRFVKI